MSAIDVQTQTAWQNAAPTWTAIVIDPLRSLAKQEPEMGAYRVYPPKHTPPANQCPDGSINADTTSRTVRWGLTYHRYYQLPISYFLSSLGQELLGTMTRNNLWVRVLSSTSTLEPDNRARMPERIKKVTDKLHALDTMHHMHTANTHQHARGGGGGGGGLGLGGAVGAAFAGGRSAGVGKKGAMAEELEKGSVAASELAIEQCKGHSTQILKHLIFATQTAERARAAREAAAQAQAAAAPSSAAAPLLSSAAASTFNGSSQQQGQRVGGPDKPQDDEHKKMDVG